MKFKEGLKAKKKKKRYENLNPPEGFCITFKIPKEDSNLAQAEKEEKRKKEAEKGRFLRHKFIFYWNCFSKKKN